MQSTSKSEELNNMKEYFCLNITEAIAEVEACKTHVAECQRNREDVKLAKAALRSAERELRDWQKGIIPTLAIEAGLMGAAA
jgi:outer membrane protein TolC